MGDSQHAPFWLRNVARYIVTIVVLTLVSTVIEHAFGAEQRERLRNLDESFLNQLHSVEPFHLASLYYGYVLGGKLPERTPRTTPYDFASRWRGHQTPLTAPPAGSIVANILMGPFVVLVYSWSAGATAFLTSLFRLIFGAPAWLDTEMNLFARFLLIPITGSAIVWVLWMVAIGAATMLRPVLDFPAMLASIPFAGAIGRTIVEERQHHYLVGAVNRKFGAAGH